MHQYSWAQPSARRPPAARGGSVITGSRGASRPPARTHAVGPGTGKSGGGPYALATPPRSRSRAPSKLHGVHPASVRGPWPHHRLENPTANVLFAGPGAQPSARRPPAAHGGSVIMGPQVASRPPARRHAVGPGNGEERGRTLRARNSATLPLKRPQQAARRSPRLSQGPMAASPPRKSHSESFVGRTRGPALGTAPARRPLGFRHHGTSRRQSPTSAHARRRAGNGEERGRTLHARNPATLPLKSPHQPHRVRRASVRGPWSAIAVARCPLAGGNTALHNPRRPPESPHSMFWLNARLRKQRPSSPPVSGGEEM